MGSGQPYLYDPPTLDSDPYKGFNPKAVTMASQMPARQQPKHDGPLLNVNRHPDSYIVLPYGKTDAKPMSPRVKASVKWTRWIQLVFRVLQLVGAGGILICVICVRGAADTEGWILRIPVGPSERARPRLC